MVDRGQGLSGGSLELGLMAHRGTDDGEEVAHRWRGFGSKRLWRGHD
jgi:hypothetical protein